MPYIKKKGKANSHEIKKATTKKISAVVNITDPSKLPSSVIIHLKPTLKDNYQDEDLDENKLYDLKYDPKLNTPLAFDNMDDLYCSVNGNNEKIESIYDNNNFDKIETTDNLPNNDKIYTAESIWCWWCCHPFQTKTIRLPLNMKTDGSLESIGSFCSPECVCAYSIEHGSKYGDYHQQIELLHSIIKPLKRIKPAPHREELSVFGGNMQIDEFRSKKNETVILHPPMVSLKLQMDDLPNEPSTQRSTDQFLNIDNLVLDDVNDTKKRKNSKKKKQKINTLDKFVEMG